jgi:rod shape-determining protein MreD
MRKIGLITVCVVLFFLIEFILFNLGGRWFMPNLLLLLIIYFNLAFGIRYSIFTAVLSGLLKDSFSTDIFGLNIFSYVVCAYMTTFLKRYLHYVASRRSRLLLVLCVTVIDVIAHFCLQMMFGNVHGIQVFQYIFVPEVITTLMVTSFTFNQLRKCVLKLSASL